MKLSKLSESERTAAIAYAKENELFKLSIVTETKDRILGYIFGLNAGGLVAGAAYLSAKPSCPLIVTAIWLFAFGLLASVVRATLDYFACEKSRTEYSAEVRNLYADKTDWETFLASRDRKAVQWPYYALGYSSGVSFFLGVMIGILGAQK